VCVCVCVILRLASMYVLIDCISLIERTYTADAETVSSYNTVHTLYNIRNARTATTGWNFKDLRDFRFPRALSFRFKFFFRPPSFLLLFEFPYRRLRMTKTPNLKNVFRYRTWSLLSENEYWNCKIVEPSDFHTSRLFIITIKRRRPSKLYYTEWYIFHVLV